MNYTQGGNGLHGKSQARIQPLVHGAHHHQSRSSSAKLVHQHSNILLTQLKIQGGVPRASEKAKVGRIVCALFWSYLHLGSQIPITNGFAPRIGPIEGAGTCLHDSLNLRQSLLATL